MEGTLTRFRIEKLHGRRNINLHLKENRVILVGENGKGKSTIANLLYYFLTRQWRRIRDYRFEYLEAEVSGNTIRLSHDDIDTLCTKMRRHLPHERLYPARYARDIVEYLTKRRIPYNSLSEERLAFEIGHDLGIPRSMAMRVLQELYEPPEDISNKLAELTDLLGAFDFGQFLYLPTYRRIEQDLKSIFRGLEIEEKIKEFRDRFQHRDKSGYIELVEFGMEDVAETIQSRMAQIKESVRTGLSNLTGTYLREVIRGLQGAGDVEVLRSIEPAAFESIFARIDEAILPTADKQVLQKKIGEIAEGSALGPDDKVIAHFLSKLVSFFRNQELNETDVRQFVHLCNDYLTDKQFVYDDVNYAIYLRQPENSSDSSGAERLELRMLSSGEKQIVSLFSHIYLSGERKFFVVIDEPELSLSVPWQERFLPDIIRTERCTGMVAVTHSPFIWDNFLGTYVQSPADFMEPIHTLQ